MALTLSSLRIRNLALVEDLTWNLAPGFTAVTGETGSGKSIIVGALKLLIGERADKALIRTGADSCTVEATFDVNPSTDWNPRLEELGLEPCEEGQLLLKRVLTAAGTNRQFINGTPTTLAVLKTLTDGLVDLHGPHDHQSLLSTESQCDLLDAFSHAQNALAAYTEVYRKKLQLERELESLYGDDAAFERECALLRHQAGEIQSAELIEDEEEKLRSQYTVASQSRRLLELTTQVLLRLSEGEDNALERVTDLGRVLRDLERIDPQASEWSAAHARAIAELEDLASGLQHYADSLDLDPERLNALEERINLIESLKRKYGTTLADVIAFGQNAAQRLHKLSSRVEERSRIQAEIQRTAQTLQSSGATLSALRAKSAPKLASQIVSHLRGLGFKKAGFQVELLPLSAPGAKGLEEVEFLFGPNLGEPAKPLRSIASSGEISRVMLAVKSALAEEDTVPLLVFDEIDANVGGEIAHAVGEKMVLLGTKRQVLCISHLPQVASKADTQFMVTKTESAGRTLSHIVPVEGEARLEEIARMLGGKSASALAMARSLLEKTPA
jgi:DNA repair protein RecN (Recombination protein N)